MRRTLFYVPHVFFELGDLGFGWLLIAWIALGVGWLAWLIWRQGPSRDTASYLPVLGIIGMAIWWLLPKLELATVDGVAVGLPIRGYGMMVMLGVIAGVALAIYQARRMGLESEVILSLAFWMFLGGISGGRAFFVVQHWSTLVAIDSQGRLDWGDTAVRILGVTQGGLVVYGAFIGGVLAALLFVYSRKLPALALADLITPSLLVGLAIGRIGCLMNGCCYGGLCEPSSPLPAVEFPRDVSPELDGTRPEHQRENSPPYNGQRQLGVLHGIHLQSGENSAAVIAKVDSSLVKNQLANGDQLSEGDIVERINGVKVHSIDDARRLLGTYLPGEAIGPELDVTTADGKHVRWTIGQLPPRSKPVHPTQVYSAINAGLIALFLWLYYPLRRRDGEVFALMLSIYPVTRYLLEIIRSDEPGRFGTSLTISQLVSGGLLVLVMGLWVYLLRRPRGSVLPMHAAA